MVKNKTNDVVKKKCKLCGKLFVPNRPWQDYCNPEEQKEYHRRIQSDKAFLAKKVTELEQESKRIKEKLGLKD